jgi:cytoskeletal protein CcmA (bactofilin family)
MFSKSSKEPAEAASATQQLAGSPAPKRAGRTNGVPSILSAEVVVRGTIVSMGDVQVDGKIEGDIRACSLVVGEKAVVAGDVYAEEATIRGRVEGSISARKVQLATTCRVSGNILHESLSVEAGAFFEGNCRHSDNPLADAPDGISAVRPSSHVADQRKVPPIVAAPKPMEADGPRQVASVAPLKN